MSVKTVTSYFEAFAGKPWRRYWIYAFDPHPNAAGHALLADELEKGLRALPDRCWKGHPPGPRKAANAQDD